MIISLYVLSFYILIPVFDFNEHDHKYQKNEQVLIWFQKVFPQNDLFETYSYSYIPICRGNYMELGHAHSGFLDAIQGLSLENSGLKVNFDEPVDKTEYCSFTTSPFVRVMLSYAIRRQFSFDVLVDGLTVLGTFGDYTKNDYEIFTHLGIKIFVNENQIVKVELFQDDLVPIENDKLMNLTYSVTWETSPINFNDRYNEYYEKSDSTKRIRVISLINSIVMMVFVMSFACWILLRTLRFDLMRYKNMRMLKDNIDIGDQYGWKLVHGDVFRRPKFYTLLSAFVGVGIHLFLTVFFTLLFAIIFNILYETWRIITFGLFIYAAISPFSAFVSASLYKKYGGSKWILHYLVHVFFFPLILLTLTSLISIEARLMNLSRYLDFYSFIYILSAFLLTVNPLSLIGYYFSLKLVSTGDFPAVVSDIPGPIPKRKWYLRFSSLAFITAILPFGTIVVEMYFVFTSFWATKILFVFQFMIVIMLVMVMVSVCSSIISTYLFLNAEDYRWHWLSYCSGMTVCVYMLIYAINYQINRTIVSGYLQLSFYYAYSLALSLLFGMVCGSFNYLASNVFVHKLYDTIKTE